MTVHASRLLGIAVVGLAACSGSPTAPPRQDAPDQILYGVQHSIVAHGLIRGRVEADSAYLFFPRGTAELYGVRSVLLDEALRQVASVDAPAGTIEFARPVLHLRGGVEVTAETAPRSLRTDELEVDLETSSITAPAAATLTEAGTARSVDGFAGTLELGPR